GCRRTPDIDWHYDIQHIAAQIRQWRRLHPDCNLVLACVEAEGLSWPAWRKRHADAEARIAHAVATLRSWLPAPPQVTLAGHSGGGSFLFGLIEAHDRVPEWVERIIFLDA